MGKEKILARSLNDLRYELVTLIKKIKSINVSTKRFIQLQKSINRLRFEIISYNTWRTKRRP